MVLAARANARAATILGALTAGMVLIAGFGAVFAFWHFGHWRQDVTGFWHYRAATLGDGVLLPVAAGIIVAAGSRLGHHPKERLWVSVAAVLGTLGGMLVPLAWVQDPSPQLNWTLPAPHTLNAAGLYHAAFLIIASGFYAAWIVRFVLRAKASQAARGVERRSVGHSPYAAVAVACLAGYCGLVVMDGAPSLNQPSSLAAPVALGVSILGAGAILWRVLGGTRSGEPGAPAWHAGMWGLVLAASVLCTVGWSSDIQKQMSWTDAFVVGPIWAASLMYLRFLRRGRRYEYDRLWLIKAGALGLIQLACLTHLQSVAVTGDVAPALAGLIGLVVLTGALLGGVVVLSVAPVRVWVNVDVCYFTAALLAPELLLVLGSLALGPQGSEIVGSGLVPGTVAAMVGLILEIGRQRYLRWIDDEVHVTHIDQKETDTISPQDLEKVAWTLFVSYAGIMTALAAAALDVLQAEGPAGVVNFVTAGSQPCTRWLLVGWTAAVAVAWLAGQRTDPGTIEVPARPGRHRPALVVTSFTLILALVAAAMWAITPWATWALVTPHTAMPGPTAHSAWMQALVWGIALLLAGWLGFVTYDTIRANVAEHEFYRLGQRGWSIAIAFGVATFSNVVWLWSAALWVNGDWTKISDIAAVAGIVTFGGAAIAVCGARALAKSTPLQRDPAGLTYEESRLGLYNPATFVCHDQLLYGASLTCTVLLCLVASRNITHFGLPIACFSLAVLLANLGAAVTLGGFVDRNTKHHEDDEMDRLSPAILRRVGGDPSVTEEIIAYRKRASRLNRYRVHIITKRFQRRFVLAIVFSPFGLLAALIIGPARGLAWLKARGVVTWS